MRWAKGTCVRDKGLEEVLGSEGNVMAGNWALAPTGTNRAQATNNIILLIRAALPG